MEKIDYLLDTNILIYILQGHPRVKYFEDEDCLFISYINEMELMGKYQMTEAERKPRELLLRKCRVLEMDDSIKSIAEDILQKHRMKLPDAITAATAIRYGAFLFTADSDFLKIKGLDVLPFKP